MNLNEIHDGWVEAHKNFYQADPKSELKPMLAIIRGDEVFVMLGNFVTDGDKERFINHAKENIRACKADAYVFCSETWLGDGREGVMTLVVSSDGGRMASIMEINRSGEGDEVLTPVTTTDHGSIHGRFAELFDAE